MVSVRCLQCFLLLLLVVVQLVSATASSETSEVAACSETNSTFRCFDNSTCLPSSVVCNGSEDCADGSDEAYCDSDQPVDAGDDVERNETVCLQTGGVWCDTCIHPAWVCDGHNDCNSGEDEAECSFEEDENDDDEVPANRTVCQETGGMWCDKCIPLLWLCDGEEDCSGGEDEQNCTGTSPSCLGDQFQCADGSGCLEATRVCDGSRDCRGGEDEGTGCHRRGACPPESCPAGQMCRSLPAGGHLCHCPPEHTMNVTGVCQRLQPCAATDGCDYRCSFDKCVCPTGLVLSSDNRTCDLDMSAAEPTLLVTDSMSLQYLEMTSRKLHTVAAPAEGEAVTGIAADFSGRSTVYWAMRAADGSAALRRRAALSSAPAEDFVTSGLHEVTAMAWEWVASVLYIADAQRHHVAACDWRGSCALVLQNISGWLLALAVSPQHGFLFWSEAGGRICRADLDGSSSHEIITGVEIPKSLAVDRTADRIYWADTARGVLENAQLDGSDRRQVPRLGALHPFSLVLLGRRLFWSDIASDDIHGCDKLSGKNRTVFSYRRSGRRSPLTLSALHLSLQPPLPNPCAGAGCSQLCLPSPRAQRRYRCFCRENMVLAADGLTCLQGNASRLLVADASTILDVSLNVVDGRAVRRQEDVAADDVTALTLDYLPSTGKNHAGTNLELTLVYADAAAGQIFSRRLDGHQHQVLVGENAPHVVAIATDPVRGNIYWADSHRGAVEVVRMDGQYRRQVVEGLNYLSGLAASAKQRHLFVSVGGRTANIQKMALDGSRRTAVVTTDIVAPASLCADDVSERLFWSDPHRGTIESVKYDGNDRRFEKSHLASPVSLAVSDDRIFWTDMYSREVHWMERRDSTLHLKQSLADFISGQAKTSLLRLTAVSPIRLQLLSELISASACEPLNCTELCLSTLQTEVCGCGEGRHLLEDSQSCDFSPCRHSQFQCRSGSCLKHVRRCDGIPDCPSGEDEDLCTTYDHAETCRDRNFNCTSDNVCLSSVLRCDGVPHCADGSDETGCDDGRCPRGEFRCGNGICLPEKERCDGRIDCGDASDERECQWPSCADTDRRCDDGRCLGGALWCDGVPDCPDGSDETGACHENQMAPPPARPEWDCSSDQRTCHDGVCLNVAQFCDGRADCAGGEDEASCARLAVCPGTLLQVHTDWLCDGEPDCDDGWDEAAVQCAGRAPPTTPPASRVPVCGADQFSCSDGTSCLQLSQACDGVFDCRDHSDEGGLCDSACDRPLCEDQRFCQPTPLRPVCGCADGLRLRADERTCEDIDECVDDSRCWNLCNNTYGSFKCDCPDGYWLNRDGVSCQAVDSPSLLVSHVNRVVTDEVRRYHFDLVYRNDNATLQFTDYDAWTEALYFFDSYQGGVFVVSRGAVYDPTSPPPRLLVTSQDAGIKPPTAMALDWTTKSVYLASRDGDVGVLHICSDSGVCRTLARLPGETIHVLRPVPERGVLLACAEALATPQQRRHGLLLRFSADGSGRTLLVDHKVDRCAGLDFDRSTGRVWWSDSHLARLGSVLLDGSSRRQFQVQQLHLPHALAVFEDWAYVISHFTHVHRCHTRLTKAKNSTEFSPLANGSAGFCESVYEKHMELSSVDVVHRLRQPLLQAMPQNGSQSACVAHSCRYLCVPGGESVVCLCPDSLPDCTLHLDAVDNTPGEGSNSSSNVGIIIAVLGAGVVLILLFAYWLRSRPRRSPSKHHRRFLRGDSAEPSTPHEPILGLWPGDEVVSSMTPVPPPPHAQRDSSQRVDDAKVSERLFYSLV